MYFQLNNPSNNEIKLIVRFIIQSVCHLNKIDGILIKDSKLQSNVP